MRIALRITAITLAASLAASCSFRTEEISVVIEFSDDKHIINTDRGRLLFIDADEGRGGCPALEADLAADMEPTGIAWEIEGDMCDFVNGAKREDYPEGVFTVGFVGFNEGAADLALFGCTEAQDANRVTLKVAPRPGFDSNLDARCITVPNRCSGQCGI